MPTPALALDSQRPTRARVWGFASLNQVFCPHGHHIRQDAFILEHGAIRCKHREPLRGRPGEKVGGGPECGAWLYVLACAGWSPQADGDDGRPACLFVAEVTYHELVAMQTRRLDVPGILDFLGVRFPIRR